MEARARHKPQRAGRSVRAQAITHAELENGLLHGDVITAYSKQEAMLKHAASGRGGDVWSIKSSLVSEWLYGNAFEREYTLVKEEF